ncbi:MAG: hypothetical protein ABI741_06375 [Ferruginibacter sp.]
MKQEISITANLNEPDLLKTMVETLASRHIDMGYSETPVPADWKAIETSCLMAYVLGTFDLHAKGNIREQVNMPFASCFLFTCIKGKYGLFNLEWSSSLS